MDFESRLRTFNKNWRFTYITPFEMAQAGFVYLGDGDGVKCHECKLRVSCWKPGYIPLCTHFALFPRHKCEFVRNYVSNYQINLIFL